MSKLIDDLSIISFLNSKQCDYILLAQNDKTDYYLGKSDMCKEIINMLQHNRMNQKPHVVKE